LTPRLEVNGMPKVDEKRDKEAVGGRVGSSAG
jgi:hypothetical protein